MCRAAIRTATTRIRRPIATAHDDRGSSPVEQAQVALREQHRRWQSVVEQQRRILRIVVQQNAHTESTTALPRLFEQAGPTCALPRCAHVVVDEYAFDEANGLSF